jgi:hypothetical protein
MNQARTLQDQAERLGSRLDQAMVLHNRRSNPRSPHSQARNAVRDTVITLANAPSAGIVGQIRAKQQAAEEAAFRQPYDLARSMLAQIERMLGDGTDTLDQSPAFQRLLPEIKNHIAQAGKLVSTAEKKA